MILDKLRENILEDPAQVRNLIPSKGELLILRTIGHGSATSPSIRGALGCSTQSASMRLCELYSKGYLTRRKVPDPTGGMMYRYYPRDCVRAYVART